MIPRIMLISVFSTVLIAASELCYSYDDSNITNEDIHIYRKLFPESKILPDQTIESTIKNNRLLAKEVLKNGVSKELQKRVRLAIEKTLSQYYIEKLKKKYAPSKEAIESFYLDHKDSFHPVEQVDISTIMVASLQKADQLYRYLQKHPEKFSQTAKKESLDPMAKNGGRYVHVPISMFNPKIREWIRKHKAGDISPPLKVGDVFFIEKLEKKYQPPLSYEALSPEIKNLLETIYVNKKIENKLKQLKEEE